MVATVDIALMQVHVLALCRHPVEVTVGSDMGRPGCQQEVILYMLQLQQEEAAVTVVIPEEEFALRALVRRASSGDNRQRGGAPRTRRREAPPARFWPSLLPQWLLLTAMVHPRARQRTHHSSHSLEPRCQRQPARGDHRSQHRQAIASPP